jgi:hypothetical protein
MEYETVLLTTYDCLRCGVTTSCGSSIAFAPIGAVVGDGVPCWKKGCGATAILTKIIR